MEADRLKIELPQGELVCDILIRDGQLGEIDSTLRAFFPEDKKPNSIAIVTDSNTRRIFGMKVEQKVRVICPNTLALSFKAGEMRKSLKTVENLAADLNRKHVDRNSILLALGGGVVGDVSGFLASIYKRGITYFQIPTTLLAQVDSSIGGKTGVDSAWGKNQLGSFHQPRAVIIDPNVLDSLPRSEIINGVAEIAKSAIIADKEMFDELRRIDLLELDGIKRFISRTCAIKAKVVSIDERETNLRSILNYGHTIGHAIEASSEYKLNHGKSVILGMIAEAWVALKMGLLSEEDYSSQFELFQRLLPSIIPSKNGPAFRKVNHILHDKKKLFSLALSDKKSTLKTIKMSLPQGIGKMATVNGDYRIPVSAELFNGAIDHLSNVLS